MIVALSRQICVDLFDAIVALRPEWAGTLVPGSGGDKPSHYSPDDGAIRVVMTGSAADDAKLRPHIYSANTRKLLETRFNRRHEGSR